MQSILQMIVSLVQEKFQKIFLIYKTTYLNFQRGKEKCLNNLIIDMNKYITDITFQLNELNLCMQCQNQLIHNLFNHIKSFINKLQLWEIQLIKNNKTHFRCLSKYNVTSAKNTQQQFIVFNSSLI